MAARNKQALVQDVFCAGVRDTSWLFYFRRELRSFELDSLKDLKAQLEEFPLDLEVDDELVWLGDLSRTFSVKSMIDVASQNVNGSPAAQNLIWKCLAPPRVQMFLWCSAQRKILTRMDLRWRGLLRPDDITSCPLCGLADETIDHLLVTCPVTWR